MSPPRLLPCGDRAVLVELADHDERRRYDAALRALAPAGVVDQVPGARTVLVSVATPTDLPRLVDLLRTLDPDTGSVPTTAAESSEPPLTIPVTYDGPDLGEVATHLGCSPAEVVTRHTGQVWRVEFAGFAPGFGYLAGEAGDLEVPRRTEPRTRVPAGSVGLAGPWSGVYPSASPGGWQLIGRTGLPMWDPTREPPALLDPQRRVQFVDVGA